MKVKAVTSPLSGGPWNALGKNLGSRPTSRQNSLHSCLNTVKRGAPQKSLPNED